jgi:hypothetical protein
MKAARLLPGLKSFLQPTLSTPLSQTQPPSTVFLTPGFVFPGESAFSVLSFQVTELVAPPITGRLVDVERPQPGGNAAAFSEDLVSFLNFANYWLWGLMFSSFVRHDHSFPASCCWPKDDSHKLWTQKMLSRKSYQQIAKNAFATRAKTPRVT